MGKSGQEQLSLVEVELYGVCKSLLRMHLFVLHLKEQCIVLFAHRSRKCKCHPDGHVLAQAGRGHMDDRPLTQMLLPLPRRRLRRPGMLHFTSFKPAKDTHTHTHSNTFKADHSGVWSYISTYTAFLGENWGWETGKPAYNPSFRDVQGDTESMTNEGTVQPYTATDESLTSGLMKKGRGGTESRHASPLLPATFHSIQPNSSRLSGCSFNDRHSSRSI